MIGFAGFVYWETSNNDVTLKELPLGLCLSIIGPITWIMGWVIFGEGGKVLFKKRHNNP